MKEQLIENWDNNRNNFIEYIQNCKSVCVVGNSVEVMKFPDSGHGEYIDSHDCVIRFGAGVPGPRLGPTWKGVPPHEHQIKCIGKKTDAWCCGYFRLPMLGKYIRDNSLNDDSWVLFNAVHAKAMDPIKKDTFLWWDILNNETRLAKHNPKNAFHMYNSEAMRAVIRSFGYEKGYLNTPTSAHLGPRISTGMWLFYFLLETCKIEKFTMIGFDFFKKSTTVRRGTKHGGLSTLDPASWYLPIGKNQAKGPDEGIEVHDVPAEYNWVVDKITKNQIEWKVLSDLKYEKIDIFKEWV